MQDATPSERERKELLEGLGEDESKEKDQLIKALQEELEQHRAEKENHKAQINTLKATISSMQEHIKTLEERLKIVEQTTVHGQHDQTE